MPVVSEVNAMIALEKIGELSRMEQERDLIRVERDRLQAWVHDLQSGMYINCVYCGHRYGPKDEVPSTMADALKAHVEACEAHPMSVLKKERDELKVWHQAAVGCLCGYDVLCNECQRLFLKAELAAANISPVSDDWDGPYCPGCGSDDLTDIPDGLFEAIQTHIGNVVEGVTP